MNKERKPDLWHQRNPWRTHYDAAKQRCKPNQPYGKRGIKFLMTVEDFKKLWERDSAGLLKQPSIDRIDSLNNYTFENCRFIEASQNKSAKKYIGWVKHGSCKECGTTDPKKYECKGLCNACYLRKFKRERLIKSGWSKKEGKDG